MHIEDEIKELQKQVSAAYVAISKLYMKMSKTSDSHFYKVIDGNIARETLKANELRDKMLLATKEWVSNWSNHPRQVRAETIRC